MTYNFKSLTKFKSQVADKLKSIVGDKISERKTEMKSSLFKEEAEEVNEAFKIDSSKQKGIIDKSEKMTYNFETSDGDIFTLKGYWKDVEKQAEKEMKKRSVSGRQKLYLKKVS